MSAREQSGVRAVLEFELARLTSHLRSMEESARQVRAEESSRPGFGKRVGDFTTEALEATNNQAVARNLQRSVAEVKRAIEKVDEGTYGVCDLCHRPIGAERLEALPSATLCIDCRRKSPPRRR